MFLNHQNYWRIFEQKTFSDLILKMWKVKFGHFLFCEIDQLFKKRKFFDVFLVLSLTIPQWSKSHLQRKNEITEIVLSLFSSQ